jgi:HPt (histidine-containing phosphotransfer) domain-containing protein
MNLEILPSGALLDVAGTLARFGGDQQLFHEIIEFFLEDAPPLLAELKRAAEIPHPPAVRSTAHALKGLVAGCGGVRAAQAAQRVEHAAQVGDLQNLSALVDALEHELELMRRAVAAYRA